MNSSFGKRIFGRPKRIGYLVIGMILIVCTICIAFNRTIRTIYHTAKLQNASMLTKSNGLRIQDTSSDEWHRDQLVRLGAMFEQVYDLSEFDNRRDIRVFVGNQLTINFPDNRHWRLTSSFSDDTSDPLVLRVWDFSNRRPQWDSFIHSLRLDLESQFPRREIELE